MSLEQTLHLYLKLLCFVAMLRVIWW